MNPIWLQLFEKIKFLVTDPLLHFVLYSTMDDLSAYVREVKEKQSASAFYKVVQLCEARIFTMCYRITGNREEAEEAAQDVFLSCYKNIHTLAEDDKFIPWALRIAYHKSIDYVRRRKIKYVALNNDKMDHQVAQNSQNDIKEVGSLDAYLSVCDDEEKAILMLYYQEEMSVKEISETLQLTVSNVKIKLFRARNKIKKFLESSDKNYRS